MGYGTGRKQDRRDAKPMHDSGDAGQEGCKSGGIKKRRKRGMQDRSDASQWGCRRGRMHERRDT